MVPVGVLPPKSRIKKIGLEIIIEIGVMELQRGDNEVQDPYSFLVEAHL